MTTRAALWRQEQANLDVKPDRREMAARSFGEFAARERCVQCREVQRKTLSILQFVQESIYTKCQTLQGNLEKKRVGRNGLRSARTVRSAVRPLVGGARLARRKSEIDCPSALKRDPPIGVRPC